jgi:hypothetical protein
MKKASLSLALLSSTLLALPPAALAQVLPPSAEICDLNLGEKALNLLLRADLARFSADLFSGLSVSARYKNDVNPSYNEGLFTRVDRYLLKVTLGTKAHELREGQDSDFVLGARNIDETEVVFHRQFRDKKLAECAAPYGTKNMPLNSAKTLANLQPGEYFSLRSKMSLVVSGTFLSGLGVESAGISAGGKYAVSGIFQTHVLRMPDGKIRLKLVGLKRNEMGIEVAAGFLGDLKIVDVSVIDKAIENFLDLNPLDFTLAKGRNNALIVEYTLDLNDQATAAAYDKVINKVTDIEDIKENSVALRKQSSIKHNMIVDIEAIDQIARADQNMAKPRVTRGFSATVDSKYTTSQLDLGIRLVHLDTLRASSENKISSIHTAENYVVNSYTKKTESGAWFSVRSTTRERQMDTVLIADDKFQNLTAEDFVISLENRERTLSPNEFARFRKDIRRMLPNEISNKMDYSQWIQMKEKRKNGYSRIQIAIHPSAMSAIGPMKPKAVFEKLDAFITKVVNEGLIKSGAVKDWRNDAQQMADRISMALNSSLSDKKRLGALMSLRSNDIVEKFGMRFLLELIPVNVREDVIKVQVKMDTTSGDKAFLNFGKVDASAIYAWNRSAIALIGDEGIDLRLEAEAISLMKK